MNAPEIVPVSPWAVPNWSEAEVAVLRERYPVGGSKLVQDGGVSRSRATIRKKAISLGLKREILFGDITGQRAGRLVAMSFVGRSARRRDGFVWLWRCDCGNEKNIISKDVTRAVRPGRPEPSCGKCAIRERGWASKKQWSDETIRHYGNKCERCGWSEARCDVHHRVPRSKGGLNVLANAIVLCPNCHRVQHAREWADGR